MKHHQNCCNRPSSYFEDDKQGYDKFVQMVEKEVFMSVQSALNYLYLSIRDMPKEMFEDLMTKAILHIKNSVGYLTDSQLEQYMSQYFTSQEFALKHFRQLEKSER